MSSDYYGFVAGELADVERERQARAAEQLQSLAVLRRYPAALTYTEDFEREWRATLNDPLGRAALTLAYQQEQAHGEACGGVRCCGTRDEVHNPWCGYGPRRRREQAGAFSAQLRRAADDAITDDAFRALYVIAEEAGVKAETMRAGSIGEVGKIIAERVRELRAREAGSDG